MVVWIVGIPLLFVHRWPRLSHFYVIFAVTFVVLSQGSRLFLGSCFLTTISETLWRHGAGAPPDSNEWFTVRVSKLVFNAAPSHRAISLTSDLLVLVTAIGMWPRIRRTMQRIEERVHHHEQPREVARSDGANRALLDEPSPAQPAPPPAARVS